MFAIQRTWEENPVVRKPRQVFITQSGFLAIKAKEYFKQSMSENFLEELRTGEKDVEQDIEFVDQDDNEQRRSELPEKFSELTDSDFPLFVTYDRVRVPIS